MQSSHLSPGRRAGGEGELKGKDRLAKTSSRKKRKEEIDNGHYKKTDDVFEMRKVRAWDSEWASDIGEKKKCSEERLPRQGGTYSSSSVRERNWAEAQLFIKGGEK